jgi:xanthine dehydrogenase large subunit
VHVYTDGSIRLNHGWHLRWGRACSSSGAGRAEVFKVDIDRIRPSATSTAEVPNTSPTAASTGSGSQRLGGLRGGQTPSSSA